MLNIKNITELRDYIVSIKDTYVLDMASFAPKSDQDMFKEKYDCGTACCLVGHAYGYKGDNSKYLSYTGDGEYRIDFADFAIDNYVGHDTIEHSYKTIDIWAFLFSSSWSDDFNEAIARMNIVINEDWDKVVLKHCWLDTTAKYA